MYGKQGATVCRRLWKPTFLLLFIMTVVFLCVTQSPQSRELLSPQPQANDLLPQPQAADLSPQTQATDLSPQPQVTDLSPQPKAADLSPQPQAADLSPQPKAADLSPKPKTTEPEATDIQAQPKATQPHATQPHATQPQAAQPQSAVEAAPCDAGYRSRGTVDWLPRLEDLLSDNFTCCIRKLPMFEQHYFDTSLKNPCWWEDGRLQCVPYFYLAGVAKSGTTDLSYRLRRHPQIKIVNKEDHWFDVRRFTHDQSYLKNYTQLFNNRVDELAKGKAVTGDCSPNYMFDSIYWKCYEGNDDDQEPRYTIPDAIRSLTPDAKIIIIMRDPVQRLFSRYLTWVGKFSGDPDYKQPTASGFHRKCQDAIRLYEQCFRERSVRACAYDGFLVNQARLMLQASMYSVYVKDWLKVFPKKQILFLKFEDYVKDIPTYLEAVYDFLELDEMPHEDVVEISKGDARNQGTRYQIIPQMLNKTRVMLQEFYSPFVEELRNIIGDEFYWNY